jgi:hypothetical protein
MPKDGKSYGAGRLSKDKGKDASKASKDKKKLTKKK